LLGKGVAFLLGSTTLLVVTDVGFAITTSLVALLLFALCYVLLRYFTTQLSSFSLSLIRFSKISLLGIIWTCINVGLWSSYSSQTITQPVIADVEGYICSIPASKSYRIQFDFCVDKIAGKQLGYLQYNKLQFSWGQYIDKPIVNLQAGQYWSFKAKLKPPHGRYNGVGFDTQQWMLAQGYAGTGQVRVDPNLLSRSSLKANYQQLRQKVYQKLQFMLPETENQGLLLALGMGERSGITTDQWEALKQSGTSHLLAISGLHLGVAALWSYWLIFYLWRVSHKLCLMLPAQKAGQVGALFGGLGILLLSGMGLPAQRAFIMLAIFIFSRWAGLYYRLSSVLGIALIVILIWHPFAVLSASFWLSFLAVLIIALVLSREHRAELNWLDSKWLDWLKINSYLYLAMLPISLSFFNMFSLTALFANLILIPITSFLLIPCLYLAMLINLFSDSLATPFYWLATYCIEMVYWVQQNLANLNNELVNTKAFTAQLGFIEISLMFLIFALLLLPKNLASRFITVPVLLLFTLTVLKDRQKSLFEMVVFDIGQGLAIYIETADGNLLFDTGWGNKEFALASSTVVPFLQARGISSINKLVISHADSDHIGGLNLISSQLEIKQLLFGESITDKISETLLSLPIKSCHNYPKWSWQQVSFEFLQHKQKAKLEGNNASCVLSIQNPYGSILLTGDIERTAEKALVKNQISQHDILIAPHHGSKTSSTARFVNAVKPKQVIFSTGFNNQWQFPKAEVLDRYRAIDSQIWITHRDGAIVVSTDEASKDFQITSSRQSYPHFWH